MSEGSGTIIIKGSGTIRALSVAESDIRTLIESNNSNVKLEGGERSGKIKSGNGEVTLENVTIPDAKELAITVSPTPITTKNVTVNGTLKLPSADPSETIQTLNLNGSGFAEDSSTEFYTLKGAPVNKLSHALDLSKPVQGDGYGFAGDEDRGFALTLGNLIIEPTSQNEDHNPIKLPEKGDVTIVLKEGTTTRLIPGNGNTAMLAPTSSNSREITIQGSGNLQIESRQAQDNAGVPVIHDGLIIAGGNIAIANTTMNPTTSGIVCGCSLNIISGKLSIKSNGPAIYAESGITLGSGVQIKTPEGADIGGFDADDNYVDGVDNNGRPVIYYSIRGEDGSPAKIVEIRSFNPAPATGGGDYTHSPFTVYNDLFSNCQLEYHFLQACRFRHRL